MSKKPLALLIAASLTLAASTSAFAANKPAMSKAATPAPASNPFLAPSTLYMQAPPFDQIKDEHYQPAMEEGMRQQKAEIRAIADSKDAPTFDNTIVALERSGALLSRARRAFGIATNTHTNDYIQKVQAEMAPKLAQHSDSITLDAPLFARIHALYEKRDTLGLDPVSLRLLERYHLDFVRSGAQLSGADQTTLRALNEEESKLTTQFSERLLKDTNAGALVVDSAKELDGLSASDIENAAVAAKARGMAGKFVIPLVNTTGQPAEASLKNRALRERIYRASIARGTHDGPNDLRGVISRLAQLRAQKAKLLGFPNYATYVLDDQMAKTPEAALKLLSQVGAAAADRSRAEIADMQAVIDRQKGGFKLQPWDYAFYAEQVRKEKYDLDESQIRPYFELDHVLKDGVFFAAHQMYGVSFKQRTDLPVYDPDARVWEVFDADGSSIGLIYTDYFARDSKQGGAWMDSLVDQSDLLGLKPVVINELNIPKPVAGQPALLTFDEVTTMFHEFGHGLHGLFSKVKYPYMSGTNTPRDFVEFPSQFNENWALEPTVLANYAKHYKTGAPMPADLVAKIKKSSTFNQGFDTLEYTEAALVDMEWYALPADAPLQDPAKFEQAALAKYKVNLPQVPPRYHSTYFSHIWPGGYGAGYYAYLWTAVLGADSFAWFQENGGMTAANGQRFRDGVLSRGGTEDAHTLYVKFRGGEPSVEPLLKQRGLVSEKKK
ncbi:M3 family metallopeptidase [Arenimonas sp.]|uniref:M3 family metallopeptidase n=1 Tax=Arenimonas sp. TaxID=1872635 RepID=UPI0039C8A859